MANTNMDLNKESKKDGPQLEFTLPLNELLNQFRVGETGSVAIPVKVTQVDKETISFMKDGEAKTIGNFRSPTASEMRKHLDVAEEEDEEEGKD